MKTSIKVDGLLDLDQALKDLAEEVGKRNARGAGRRALIAAAQPIFRDILAGAPDHIKPAVDIGDRLTPRQARIARMGGLDRTLLPLFVGVNYKFIGNGFPGRTAHLFEFGTASRKQTSTGRATGRIRAVPFVRLAWDANQMRALEILRTQLWVEIKRTTERARRKAARAAAKLAGR